MKITPKQIGRTAKAMYDLNSGPYHYNNPWSNATAVWRGEYLKLARWRREQMRRLRRRYERKLKLLNGHWICDSCRKMFDNCIPARGHDCALCPDCYLKLREGGGK